MTTHPDLQNTLMLPRLVQQNPDEMPPDRQQRILVLLFLAAGALFLSL